MINLAAQEVMRLTVKVAAPKIVGKTNRGFLQVIPIVGGFFAGKNIKGKVVPGGADWNTTLDEGIAHVFAKYLLETDDGEIIAIENEGYFNSNSISIIKTTPKFQTNLAGKYGELNFGTYVGELNATPNATDSVDIVIFKLK
ncbi:MAG: DUF3237 domain-containing protein [Anaerolinea sp.]|nr:DUF3237 domain-containing protein [Anaerolinea sp.]